MCNRNWEHSVKITQRHNERKGCYEQLYSGEEERDKDYERHSWPHPSTCLFSSIFLSSSNERISSTDTRWEDSIFKKSGNSFFFFYKKKSLLLLLSYLFFSGKVTNSSSIHKYTQPVMLTHYSPLRGWLPSVTLGHKQNQIHLPFVWRGVVME